MSSNDISTNNNLAISESPYSYQAYNSAERNHHNTSHLSAHGQFDRIDRMLKRRSEGGAPDVIGERRIDPITMEPAGIRSDKYLEEIEAQN